MKYFFLILIFLLMVNSVRADHELDIYAFDDFFIYDTFTKGSALKTFHIVSLEGNQLLKVTGAVQSQADYNVDAFSHYKNYLIVLLWNQVEIYDLNDSSNPVLAKTYKLQEHKPWPGNGRIIREENKFTLLSTKTSSVLTMDDDINKWKVSHFERTEKFHKSTLRPPNFPAFNSGIHDSSTFIVKETNNYKYEIIWKTRRLDEYSIAYEKYLIKTKTSNNKLDSELLMGQIIETGGD